jgi:hypothetical protein
MWVSEELAMHRVLSEMMLDKVEGKSLSSL